LLMESLNICEELNIVHQRRQVLVLMETTRGGGALLTARESETRNRKLQAGDGSEQ
jgi:hypothetical protein